MNSIFSVALIFFLIILLASSKTCAPFACCGIHNTHFKLTGDNFDASTVEVFADAIDVNIKLATMAKTKAIDNNLFIVILQFKFNVCIIVTQ